MDIVAAIAGVSLAVIGFMLGRVWGLREHLALQAEYEKLYRDYSRISTRGPGGRFIKVDK